MLNKEVPQLSNMIIEELPFFAIIPYLAKWHLDIP